MIAAGAVGLNFEDMIGNNLVPLENQLQRLRKLRAVADESGLPLVINARTDIYLAEDGAAATRFERTVERLNAFRAAGADCLFVPGVRDAKTIVRLVSAIDGPVDVPAQPGSSSTAEMKALGVARVSLGGGPSHVAMGAVRRLVRSLRDHGTFAGLADEAIPAQEMQALLDCNTFSE